MRHIEKGDKYRPVISVLKAKNGVPTKVYISGQVYALVHDDDINGSNGVLKKDYINQGKRINRLLKSLNEKNTEIQKLKTQIQRYNGNKNKVK